MENWHCPTTEFRSPPITGRKLFLAGNPSSGIDSSAIVELSSDPRSHTADQDDRPGEHLLETLNVPPNMDSTSISQKWRLTAFAP